MTDFMERARAELLAEDAALLNRRIEARAQSLRDSAEREAQMAANTLPTDVDEARTRLAQLRSRHDGLSARKERSRRNPALAISAAEDAEIDRLRSQIETLEKTLRVFGRLEGKNAA